MKRTKPDAARPRGPRERRGEDQRDDAGGRHRRHRHGGADPGDRGGRQDGHRGDGRRAAINTTWFISFAPADDPKVAVAVVVENQQDGFGGTVAAPIAKAVMQAILDGQVEISEAGRRWRSRHAHRHRLRRALPHLRASSARAGWRTSTSPRTRSSGRNVAIKILDDRHASDDQFVERFRREAKNAAGLSHPNIVSIYDRGEAEGTYYIAMEYLDGRTLKELIIRARPDPAQGRDRLRAADPRRGRLRAQERDRPPRHQAAQRPRRQRGPPQGDRLRDRPLGRRAR